MRALATLLFGCLLFCLFLCVQLRLVNVMRREPLVPFFVGCSHLVGEDLDPKKRALLRPVWINLAVVRVPQDQRDCLCLVRAVEW